MVHVKTKNRRRLANEIVDVCLEHRAADCGITAHLHEIRLNANHIRPLA
jgi:hypothetical protein